MNSRRVAALLATSALLSLAACDRANPPSEKLERAAEEMVTGEPAAEPVEVLKGPLAPRNDCTDLPGAPAFLAALRTAVEERDADALASLAADDIKLDFGGGAGIATMRQRLAADGGRLWGELERILDLGCAAKGDDSITMPWYFAQETDADPATSMLVMGQDVPMYQGPDERSAVIARISWDRATIASGNPGGGEYRRVEWTDPESGEDVSGFVRSDQLRSMLGYRLMAARRNDRWRIVNFLAGD
ncbi:hypothetical protein [Aurantiacibacter spongiae]|uniref:SH3 domain-containing protein n=1 Tax=Aurantiacibacter spongiae TaxID=2488860 RepID=A0A3N5DN35_9SPHN|nr:hypothetical protein [Aurantiacibacter spongiae]RPF72335.1 hypothetical protein EG799_12400 [Aurantiacibacter spongiae]